MWVLISLKTFFSTTDGGVSSVASDFSVAGDFSVAAISSVSGDFSVASVSSVPGCNRLTYSYII